MHVLHLKIISIFSEAMTGLTEEMIFISIMLKQILGLKLKLMKLHLPREIDMLQVIVMLLLILDI